MSIKLMSEVWRCELSRPEQAILLALADHADDSGANVFPSIAHIGWKTGYSDRQVQRIMSSLRERSILEIVAPATWNKPTEYQITLANAPRKPRFVRGDKMSGGDIAVSERGDIAVSERGDIVVTPESSLTISNHHNGKEPPSISAEKETTPKSTIEVNAGPYGANLFTLPLASCPMTNRKPKCHTPHDKQETQMSSKPSLTIKEQSLTIAAAEYFDQFRRKRWATKAQQKLFEITEQAVGADIMLAAVRWAAQNNIAKVPSICTAAKKMAKKQVQYGGHGGRIPAAGASR